MAIFLCGFMLVFSLAVNVKNLFGRFNTEKMSDEVSHPLISAMASNTYPAQNVKY